MLLLLSILLLFTASLFDYSDGNAKGGETLDDADYIVSTGILEFKHGEASKTINLRCSEAKVQCVTSLN